MMIVSSISRYNEGLGCARPRSNETMIILTGGAGFIGSNLLGALNAKDVTDVMVVDRVGDSSRNLKDLRFSDLMRPEEFARAIERGILPNRIEAIFHQGACADTTCTDGRYMVENNFTFSKLILQFAVANKIPLVYASSAAVYGSSSAFAPSRENERPLNLYGLSKLAFDNHVQHCRHIGEHCRRSPIFQRLRSARVPQRQNGVDGVSAVSTIEVERARAAVQGHRRIRRRRAAARFRFCR